MTTKMSKKEFWIRFALYIVFGGAIPFVFLVWRFNLFQTISKVSIGGWGLVAIIFIALFFISLIKQVKAGMPFSILTQVLEGLCKVTIPLLIATFVVYYLHDLTTEIFQFLVVMTISETVALVVNPLKQWRHENKIEEGNESLIGLLQTLGVSTDKTKKE